VYRTREYKTAKTDKGAKSDRTKESVQNEHYTNNHEVHW